MKEALLLIYLFSILFSAIMAFIYRKGLKSGGIFIFLPYLFLVSIQELGIFLYREFYSPTPPTGIIYNFYRLVTVLVFSYIYYIIPFSRQVKKIILSSVVTYLVVTIVERSGLNIGLVTDTYSLR